jgi:hypothetical protein
VNIKTTLVLLVLVAAVGLAGAAYWFRSDLPAWLVSAPPEAAVSPSVQLLEKEFTPNRLTHIEVVQGDRRLVLERSEGGEWSLPGKWPTRKAEVDGLVTLLSSLRTRFTPEAVEPGGEQLKTYGLDHPAVTVTLRAGGKDYKLAFAEKEDSDDRDDKLASTEKQSSSNRFSRPTYLRIDDRPEVVHLPPGVVASLDRPVDYYQQRRLFLSERVPREPGSSEKVERLAAQTVALTDKTKEGSGSWTLTRAGDEWELSQPVRDRTDSEKVRPILTAVPDIWAEVFVERGNKDLAEFGLKEPEQTLRVTPPNGGPVTLLIGKVSPTVRERKLPAPAPVPGMPFQPPPQVVKETYRYAKLENNEQIFEIRADTLKDLFVPVKDLRDARLARFRADDARRLEVKYDGQDVVLAKEKDRWRLEKPIQADAETAKVNELLDKLAALEARDTDVIDHADAKTYGFDDPARVGTVKVTVEEEKGEGEAKKKTTRSLAYSLGKDDKEKKKLYVRADSWPRVNAVDDSLVSLAKRTALAYRGRRVLDFAVGDVDRIEVKRGTETLTLKHDKGDWKLTGPPAVEVDAGKASTLAASLGTLEAASYVKDAPDAKELDSYGLAKDALAAKVVFSDTSKKPAQTLLIGKSLPEKPDQFYARLESGTSVFAVTKALRDSLEQDALSYRPLQLWRLAIDGMSTLRVKQAGQDEYRLTRKDGGWQIAGPFEATAQATLVTPMLTELTAPRCERYETAQATDLKKYGLDEPHLRVVLITDKAEGKGRTLLIGKETSDPQQRYAKLADSDAIFVVSSRLTSALDHGALDLLDRRLLALDPKTIERVDTKGGAAPLTLQRKGDGWQVTESPAPAPFAADGFVAEGYLAAWFDLQASHFAAYGPKVDLAKFGLDKPATTVTVTVQPPDVAGKKPPVQTHTLALGKEAEGGQRYARVDNGPGVAVLSPFLVREFAHTYLDFVDHSLLKFDAAALTGLKRQMGANALEVVKKDEWQILKPSDQKADEKTMQQLADRLASLRAVRVAAYPAKDLKTFGLDAPAALVTLQLGGDKPSERVLKIGNSAVEKEPAGIPPERFVQVEGSPVIAVMSGPLAEQLLAAPVRFRDHAIARFADADKIVLERGPRQATFANVDGTWKLTEPATAPAEQIELEDFINSAARLRAEEMVAEKPDDLKPYGLDKPQARWRFLSGTKEVLNLLIGGFDKTGRRCYAKLAAGDVVFLLDAPTTNRVLAEYRTRTVWPGPLDAAQVESVRFGSAKNPFTLEKIDNLWQVAGKPDALVNVQAVNATLDALARLRVERYVLDKGADPKLYGLDPPELVIDVQTRDGKRTLQIGRTEGNSRRYYARVQDKDRSDVFVISEADGALIVRDLAAFTEKLPRSKP